MASPNDPFNLSWYRTRQFAQDSVIPITGSVISVSVVPTTQITGTVANPTTTPAIALNLVDTGVTPGNYTNATITVGADGRIILASNGAAGAGTVTAVTIVSGNGFTGSVTTNTTTPALHINTTVTGMVKGNGSAISAAIANVDYIPAAAYITATGLTMASARLLGRTTAAAGPAEEISIGANLTLAAGVLSATGGTGTVTHVSTALTANAVMLGNGAADAKVVIGLGTLGQVLTSNGPASPPTFQNSSGGGGAFVLKTGDTMTGALIIDPGLSNVVPFPLIIKSGSQQEGTHLQFYGNQSDQATFTLDFVSDRFGTSLASRRFIFSCDAGQAVTINGGFVLNGDATFNQNVGIAGTLTAAAFSVGGNPGIVGSALTTNALAVGSGTSAISTPIAFGTAGQTLTSNGAGVPPSFQNSASSPLVGLYAPVTITTAATETSILGTPTIPGGTLTTDFYRMELVVPFTYFNSGNAGTITVKVKIGAAATIVFEDPTLSITSGAISRMCELRLTILRTGPTTASGSGTLIIGSVVGATTGRGDLGATSTLVATYGFIGATWTWTDPTAFDITFACSATSGTTLTTFGGHMRKLQ